MNIERMDEILEDLKTWREQARTTEENGTENWHKQLRVANALRDARKYLSREYLEFREICQEQAAVATAPES